MHKAILKALNSIKRDTAALVRFIIEPDVPNDPCAMCLPEPRQKQVDRVSSLMHDNPNWSLHRACREVMTEMKLDGGYPCIGSLYRYCNHHCFDTRR